MLRLKGIRHSTPLAVHVKRRGCDPSLPRVILPGDKPLPTCPAECWLLDKLFPLERASTWLQNDMPLRVARVMDYNNMILNASPAGRKQRPQTLLRNEH